MIQLEQIEKTYGKKPHVFSALKKISFTLKQGETVAVIGKSGSGKSTLMHVMSGLDHPSSGTVTVNGQDFSKMKQKQIDTFRANEMSFIFQSFFIQGKETCYENVSLPLEIAGVPRRQRDAKIKKALQAVELEEKAKQRAKDLSGGQKQRLAIARAIVNEPAILFADEPTGNLDSVTSKVVENLLFDYAKNNNATLIMVTHDDDLAKLCQRQIRLKDGEILSDNGAAKSGAKK